MDIEQAVAAYNDQRKGLATTQSKRRRTLNYILAIGAIVLVAVSLWIYFSGYEPKFYAVPIVGIMGLLGGLEMLDRSAKKPGKDLQKTVRERIFPALLSNIQDLRFQTETKGFFDEMSDDLKPEALTHYKGGDLIEGIYQGQPIAINEVTVSARRGVGDERKSTVVFKGLAVRTGLDHPVPNLSVSTDENTAHRLAIEQYRATGNTERLVYDDVDFETIYVVRCQNEAFAESVFSEAGRSTFMRLQGGVSKSPLQLSASESTAYLLLSQQDDFFELPSIDRPFDTETDGRRLQDEMQGLLDLISTVRDLLKTGSTT